MAFDEGESKSVFERLDSLTHGRLGDGVCRRGLGKPLQLDHVTEEFEGFNVHVD